MEKNTIRLTELVKAGGWGSKISASDLETVLEGLPRILDPNLLFGTGIGDDAGVYQLREDLAIVQTVDFFTPIVDDPYDFGVIAAANALSDCYTLGAQPLTALNIVAFPCAVGLDVLREILRGGADTIAESGACIVGGHSVQDSEPKYGVAVTGTVHPRKMVRNDTARVGDRVLLNKAIGTGIVSNLWKKGGLDLISAEVYAETIRSMKQIHKAMPALFEQFSVSAATDITGFGLLGHVQSIAGASNVGFEISANSVPSFPGVRSLAHGGGGGGAKRNQAYIEAMIDRDSDVSDDDYALLHDAQTSGPILCCVAPEDSAEFIIELQAAGYPYAADIGVVTEHAPGRVRVRV